MIPGVAVIDGGFASLLVEQGHKDVFSDPLFGARLLKTNKDAVYKVHWGWLEAGADVIETATYQTSIKGLQEHLQLSKDEALMLMAEGAKIALRARDEFWERLGESDRMKPLVAGSCGPYGACLLDGSEYTGAYLDSVSVAELVAWHRPRVDALLRAGVDMLAFETFPSAVEGQAVVELLKEFPDAKAWVSFSCKDGAHTSRGELFSEACLGVVDSPQVFAVGINCTAPQHITALLKSVHSARRDKLVLVYPNSGEQWSAEKDWHGREGCVPVSEYVEEWVREGGVDWVGGCCRVFPSDITRIRFELLRVTAGAESNGATAGVSREPTEATEGKPV